MRDPQTILIALPNWVGDVVMATPALAAIRARFPRAAITGLIRQGIRGLIESCPWVDDWEVWPAKNARGRQGGTFQVAFRLRRRRMEWALLMTNSFRSALVARLAGIPRRIGYDRDGRGWLLTDRIPVQRDAAGRIARTRMVNYYGELAVALGCDRPGDRLMLHTRPEDDAVISARLEAAGLAGHRPIVVMTPGASFGPAKCWPADRFAAVCDRLVDECGARVVLTYGPGEESVARRAIEAMRHRPLVMEDPAITLSQLKSLIRLSDLLLCNDTGPRHLAKAFDVPVVTVFGPTWPQWTDTDYRLERIVRIDVDCGPCQKPVCPLGHVKCMTEVGVEAVFDACRELLARRPA
jgi:heptosyltransferase-2